MKYLFLVALFVMGSAHASKAPRLSNSKAKINKGEMELIYKVKLRMPYGDSVWEDSFAATGSNPLRITYTKSSGCPQSPYMAVAVRVKGSSQWQTTKYQNGLDYYDGGAIDGIRFTINQPFFTSMSCEFNIYAAKSDYVVEPGQEEVLVGAKLFEGGFVKDAEFALPQPMKVSKFRIFVPTFCPNIDVLEAFTITEGMKSKASLVAKEKNLFAVADGKSMPISKIGFSAIGPTGASCSFPIYVQE